MKKYFLCFIVVLCSAIGSAQTGVALASKQTAQIVAADTANARLNRLVSGSQTISAVRNVTVSTISQGTINAGGFTTVSNTTITMSVAGAYATGDYMGTTTSPQSFTNAVRVSGGSGVIKGIVISDKITNANVDMELWLLNASFTAPTDNAAWAISDAEATTVLGIISISSAGWKASANNQVYYDDSFSIPFKLPTGTSIYYALVARGTTPAFTSLDLSIGLKILQD
jgi:hypothetical protein